MKKNASGKLLIVESPAKAKTIEKYLDHAYTVKASVGHVRDLPKSNKKAIDIEKGFVPHYENLLGKEEIIADLKKIAKKADEVVLATDPDREGEAIAWHLSEALGLKNPKRIVFNEITENAVKEAIKHPRSIDMNLLRAQEARRVLDRLVGYDLSGLIWKKVRYGLSAGRVQSPALRIIMEREREIRSFIPETFFVLEADLLHKKDSLLFTCSEEPKTAEEASRIKDLAEKGSWSITHIKETEVSRQARPPFTTSTLQQAASTRLGFSPSRTMGIAQKLYEAGLITYMRTDSPNLSKDARESILAYVAKRFGNEYAESHVFTAKSKNAQEAHEAIRPTDVSKAGAGNNPEQKNLYELIWRRAVSSQMTPAKMLRTRVEANVSVGTIPDFVLNGARLLFPGWLEADPEAGGEDTLLPKLSEGDVLSLSEFRSIEKQTEPPPRYTEAGLVKELEKRGIGRPSTYASIIKTIVDRGYVEKEARSLRPTDTGDVVSSFLEAHFTSYVSDTFTAEMEDKLDEIAEGKREYRKTLEEFYKDFSKEVKSKEKLDKLTTLGEADPNILCPVCKNSMVIKLGRGGKFLSCARFPDCVGARTIDGKELEGPKETGEECPDCKGKLVQREGRFGLFIACGNYPKCKYIKKDGVPQNTTGVKCPVCTTGEMAERRGRFGIFYSCTNYPKCKNAIKAKPTGELCAYDRGGKPCGALLMEGTKTIPVRCSDKTCPNHNPHKLEKIK